MAAIDTLVERIRKEFSASEAKLKAYQQQAVEQHHAKQQRLESLERVFDSLSDVWRPRLEALAKEFGDRVQTTPTLAPGRRQATLRFKSPLATICLRFSAGTNDDVSKLVLAYDLEVLPILMEFERHAEISFPLDQIKPDEIGQWLDNRIVNFVKTYLAMYENPYYQKDQMVSDPIANVGFPKFAAGASRQKGNSTYYFLSEETAAEFDKQG